MTRKRVQLNCKNFKCANNKKGNCLLEGVRLNTRGTPIVSEMFCEEASEKLPQPDPNPDE